MPKREIELIFDDNDRIFFQGSMDFSIRSMNLTIDDKDAVKVGLIRDCSEIFTARSVDRGQSYSSGSTYFQRADKVPRCALEALALTIFRQHTEKVIKLACILLYSL